MTSAIGAPGVYVQEVPSGARPIQAVGTSTAAFVGQAPDAGALLGEAKAVNSWTEFVRNFANVPRPQGTALSRAVWGFFANGGGRCYIVNHPEGQAIEGGGARRSGLQLLEAVDEVAIVAAPGYVGVQSYEALLGHCERLEDRVAILDAPAEVDDIGSLVTVGTLGSPRGPGRPDKPDKPEDGAEGDAPPPAHAAAPEANGLRPRPSSYGAFYFPWIVAYDTLSQQNVPTAPSGHMAGVWARVDANRGVHKAPANEPIVGALDLTYLVTRGEQANLNPAGVNCIRKFGAEGIRVWGARTVAPMGDPFIYLNVRRLFNMLKESIAQSTTWIVFEPNEYKLWTSISTSVSEFLTRVWRDGALFGRTPQEAFFVKCDEETNPVEERNAGRVTALVGVAPVKPAEFVVFQISQWSGGTEIEMVGG